ASLCPNSAGIRHRDVALVIYGLRRQGDKIARTRGSFKRNKEPAGSGLEQSNGNEVADPKPNYTGAAPVLECRGKPWRISREDVHYFGRYRNVCIGKALRVRLTLPNVMAGGAGARHNSTGAHHEHCPEGACAQNVRRTIHSTPQCRGLSSARFFLGTIEAG